MPTINMQVFEELRRNQLVTVVDIQTQVALDDYQVHLSDIANPTQSQDNVVIDRHGEFLPHWNESLDFDTWVKISMEVAGKRILMLSGNTIGSNASNGDDTFVQYHGTSTAQFFDAEIQSQPLVFEAKVRATSDPHEIRWGVVSNEMAIPRDGAMIQTHTPFDIVQLNVYDGAQSQYANEAPHLVQNDWYQLKIIVDGTHVDGYVNDNPIESGISENGLIDNMGLFMFKSAGNGEQDWSFIRKYTATEPTWAADGEEQNIAVALKLLGRAG